MSVMAIRERELFIPPDLDLPVHVCPDDTVDGSQEYSEELIRLLSGHGARPSLASLDRESFSSSNIPQIVGPVSIKCIEGLLELTNSATPDDYGRFSGIVYLSMHRDDYGSPHVGNLIVNLQLRGYHVAHPELDRGELLYCEPLKLVDLLLCKTKHTRYVSVKKDDRVGRNALETHYDSFRASVYQIFEERLFNSLTDGCISVRLDDGSFLVSASRTQKEPISFSPDRLTQIVGWDLATNVIEWRGPNPPSSSSPWHLQLLSWMPDVHAVVHTHTRDVTYSCHRAAAEVRSSSYARYGLPSVGASLLKASLLSDSGQSFLSPARLQPLGHVGHYRL